MESANSKIDTTLAQINLVQTTQEKLPKAPYGQYLVTVNNFNGEVTVKGTGYGLRLPAFETGYLVSIGTFDVKVMNPDNSSTGRYEQNIGIGEDISLSLKIKFRVSKDPQLMAKFLTQQETWKNAVKTATENIMKQKIDSKKSEIENCIKNSRYSDIILEDVDLVKLANRLNQGQEQHEETMALEAIRLRYNYGIELINVNFVDVDVPDRIKNARVAEFEAEKNRRIERENAENQRQIEKQNAENTRQIAIENAKNEARIEQFKEKNKRIINQKNAGSERTIKLLDSENQKVVSKNQAEATVNEYTPIVKFFKKQGYTNAEINEYLYRVYGIKYLPENSTVIYGMNSNNISMPIMPKNYNNQPSDNGMNSSNLHGETMPYNYEYPSDSEQQQIIDADLEENNQRHR